MSSQRLEAHFTLVHVKTMRAFTTHRTEFTAPRVTKRFEISHVKGLLTPRVAQHSNSYSYLQLNVFRYLRLQNNPRDLLKSIDQRLYSEDFVNFKILEGPIVL